MNKLALLLLTLLVLPQAFADQYSCVAICIQRSSVQGAVDWSVSLPPITVNRLADAKQALTDACRDKNGNDVVSFLETATANNVDYGISERQIKFEKPFDTSLCKSLGKDQARLLPSQAPYQGEATARPDHE